MAWLAVFGMGLVLGTLGGGGGILTVPILVGLFGMSATAATGSSLLVVGLASSIGAVRGLFAKQVDLQSGILLALPSMAGAFAARKVLVPAIPERIGSVSQDDLLLGAFALVMVLVGIRMLRPPNMEGRAPAGTAKVVLIGLGIGLVSGVLGAGGGFLILPALAVLLGVDIVRAIPTSLLVITLQSLGGFAGELGKPIEWRLLGQIVAIGIAGLVLGLFVRERAPKQVLQKAFAALVFVVAAWMVLKIFLNHF